MNSAAIGHIAWKEIRHHAPLFLIIVIAAILVQLFVQLSLGNFPDATDSLLRVSKYGLLGAFCALFSAACGATLFATERENDTWHFLKNLPISNVQLITGKITGGIALVAAFFLTIAVALLIMFQIGLIQGSTEIYSGATTIASAGGIIAITGLAAVEFFLWGWLCSLIFKRALNAAIVAALFASASVCVIVGVYHRDAIIDAFTIQPYLVVWPWRLGLAGIVFLVNIGLSQRCLVARSIKDTAKLFRFSLFGVHHHSMRSLIWHAFRQYQGAVGIVVLLSLPFVLVFPIAGRLEIPGLTYLVVIPLVLAPLVIGHFSFGFDQAKQRFQFFQQQGEYPTQLWFCRVVIGLLIVLLLVLFVGVYIQFLMASHVYIQSESDARLAGNFVVLEGFGWFYLLIAISGFAIGLWSSQAFESSLLSGVVSIFLYLPVMMWSVLMAVLGVPLIWSVLPIAIAFLISARLRTESWIVQRKSFVSWFVPIIALLIPFGFILWGAWHYRATEIPIVEVDIRESTEAGDRLAVEIQTEYQQALTLFESQRDPELMEISTDRVLLNDFNYRIARQWKHDQQYAERIPRIKNFLNDNKEFIERVTTLVDKTSENPQAFAESDISLVPRLVSRGSDSHSSGYALIARLLHYNSLFHLVFEPDIDQGLDAIELELSFLNQAMYPHFLFNQSLAYKFNVWLNMSGQTVRSLERAEEFLNGYEDQFPEFRDIAGEYYRKGLANLNSHQVLNNHNYLLEWIIRNVGCERERFKRLNRLECALAIDETKKRWRHNFDHKNLNSSDKLLQDKQLVSRYRAKSYLNQLFIECDRIPRDPYWLCRDYLQVTQVSIRLVKYALENETYPERLDMILTRSESKDQKLAIQDFSSTFQGVYLYLPSGLTQPISTISFRDEEFDYRPFVVARPGQPFLLNTQDLDMKRQLISKDTVDLSSDDPNGNAISGSDEIPAFVLGQQTILLRLPEWPVNESSGGD